MSIVTKKFYGKESSVSNLAATNTQVSNVEKVLFMAKSHHDTQHNNIQHNDTQHKGLVCDTEHK
jgi:hypothetical protein